MLFNFPSFISTKEQTKSELLFNDIKLLIQTHISEIWFDLDFGTNIRNNLKQGIDNLVLSEIRDEIETKLNKYFYNDLTIDNLNIYQNVDKIMVELQYTELRSGLHKTIQSEEVILNNNDTSLY